jgi:tetratricopeptide (TPR) repeat protein
LHVESVAWVAERKDVLSAFFWLLILLFYSEYVIKRTPALYILSLFSFVLGLMAKPMLVTLPIVMLLMDFWPLHRYRHEGEEQRQRRVSVRTTVFIKEKIPFFIFSFLSAVITIYAQNESGAVKGFDQISLELRVENALIAYVKYIGKTLWPHDLAVFYPIPLTFPLWQVIGSLFVLLLISGATIWGMRRYPYLATGWFWFIVTLLPVIGLIQVGGQSMADRYTYIPMIGLLIMVAWGSADLTRNLRHQKVVLALLAGVAIIASTALTWRQIGYWRDDVTLFRHTLQVTTDNSYINYNLGVALAEKGELDAAIREYLEAVRISPDFTEAHTNLGIALAKKGNLDAAIRELREALRISPNETIIQSALESALSQKRLQNELRK